ncbi:YdeI/OmpD-associated family protein [Devosia sp. Root685]|uniref:YdeI/OmpD-associated family protein n=1 Tax=Devosia sp. Root685 TaxID=1736587 RepID=UPI000A8B9889|nr:YdeI/OmpD-associated family protein [Devosia sp. Root685]
MSPVLRPLRKREDMPEFVRVALEERGLSEQYQARPPYQRNDYLMWINSAKQDATKQKRLGQMLEELEARYVYMRMDWNR